MKTTVYHSETVTANDILPGQLVWVDGIIDEKGRKLNERNRIMSVGDKTVTLKMEYLTNNESGEQYIGCVDSKGNMRSPGKLSSYSHTDLLRRVSNNGHIWWSIKLDRMKGTK
jgi:hypothetical protein